MQAVVAQQAGHQSSKLAQPEFESPLPLRAASESLQAPLAQRQSTRLLPEGSRFRNSGGVPGRVCQPAEQQAPKARGCGFDSHLAHSVPDRSIGRTAVPEAAYLGSSPSLAAMPL